MVDDSPSVWSSLTPTQRDLVLALLRYGRLSRPQIMERMSISLASITRLTTPLIDAGLLNVSSEQVASTGRPQNPLEVNANLESIIGVCLSGHTLTAVLTSVRAQVLARARRTLTSHTPGEVVTLLRDAIDELIPQAPSSPSCLGISLGGSSQDGRIVDEAVFLGWHSIPLATQIEEATGLPSIIGNDLTAMTQQEAWFGAGRSYERFCLITVGAGIGFGLVVDGQVISTTDSEHGLMGMIPISDGARPPAAVPAQSALTSIAIEQQWERLGHAPTPASTIEALATGGDTDAVDLAQSFAQSLGRFVGTAAAFTLPQAVVIAGERSAIPALFEDSVMEGIAQVRRAGAKTIPLIIRDHDRTTWAQGAATLALRARVAGRLEACV